MPSVQDQGAVLLGKRGCTLLLCDVLLAGLYPKRGALVKLHTQTALIWV